MAKKIRMTPFARFFIVMLFVAPLAYIVASYYNGKDGIEEFKKLIGIEKSDETPAPEPAAPAPEPRSVEDAAAETPPVADSALEAEVEMLKSENQQLREALKRIEKDLAKKDLEIKNLQQQLESLKGTSGQ